MTEPMVARFLAALEETQYYTPGRMVEYQRRPLEKLLHHARAETDFYAEPAGAGLPRRRQHRPRALVRNPNPDAGRGAAEHEPADGAQFAADRRNDPPLDDIGVDRTPFRASFQPASEYRLGLCQ